MLAGDQHLPTVTHMGIDDFDDAGWAFSVPSIVNYYSRWWSPLEKAVKRVESPLKFAGSYYDGFRNRLTMHAYANPGDNSNITSMEKYVKRSAGHGVVRFNKSKRTITMECWPRGSDVTKKDAKQYPGWPIVITQEDNYSKVPAGYLPVVRISGMTDAIIQVKNQSTKEVVYTIRANGNQFHPMVFDKDALYTLTVGNQNGKEQVFKDLKAVDSKSVMKVTF